MTRTVNKKTLVQTMAEMNPDWPPEVLQAAVDVLVGNLVAALEEERPISLKGFGRLWLRRYDGGRKSLGCLFRPSPRLARMVNAEKAEED